MNYTSTIETITDIARATIAVSWKRPESFLFKAGQSIDMTLLQMPTPDKYGATRSFSIVSAPNEKNITVAMRVRDSSFKQKLDKKPTDQKISWEGPYGGMTLPDDTTRPLVFFAGGIGITPFMSMLREIVLQKTNHRVILFYSNRTRADAAFFEELTEIARTHSHITFICTFTQTDQNSHGRIDEKMIREHTRDLEDSKFFLAGPPRFTTSIKNILIGMSVPRTSILNEVFDGY